MDLDAFYKEFRKLKNRLEPMLAEHEARKDESPPKTPFGSLGTVMPPDPSAA